MNPMQTAVRDAIRQELEEAGVYPHPTVLDGCAEAAINASVQYTDLIIRLAERPATTR